MTAERRESPPGLGIIQVASWTPGKPSRRRKAALVPTSLFSQRGTFVLHWLIYCADAAEASRHLADQQPSIPVLGAAATMRPDRESFATLRHCGE
jgi:hypothetical protein